jgi:3',5'-nucleoside bisphosphate phosphatase
MIFADLHNHTFFSDGDFSPKKLVGLAKRYGIKAIGITDHDTLAGLDEAVFAGEKYEIEVITGVEVSICFKLPVFRGTLHLLCYFSVQKLGEKQFKIEFKKILSNGRGEDLVRARVAEINRVFGPGGEKPLLLTPMRFEDISAYSQNVSRRHFAFALQEKHNIQKKETLNSIIGNDSSAYLPSGIALSQLSEFIYKYDILAVLAHPAAGSFSGKGHYKKVLPKVEIVKMLLPDLIDAGVKGLEVYYPGHDKEHESLMLEWAKSEKLVVTGGSDCHDETERPFGIKGISESDFMKFKENLL